MKNTSQLVPYLLFIHHYQYLILVIFTIRRRAVADFVLDHICLCIIISCQKDIS